MTQKICIVSTKKLQSNQMQFLLNADFSVINADFIKIEILPFQLKNVPSLLLFTSQNAVKSVLQSQSVKTLKQIPAICVGVKTKKMLQENGFNVLATTGYAEELTPVILQKFAKEHIAFFAGNLRRDVLPVAMQQAKIPFDEYTVYQNSENPVKIITNTNAVLFFSPSGVNSYLKKNTITNQVCFCIGKTTADALEGVTENRVIAKQQTVENVIIQCINYYK